VGRHIASPARVMSDVGAKHAGPVVDGDSFRAGMRRSAAGVAIVTTEFASELHGMTVSSFTAVSLDPPLVSVCFIPETRTARSVEARGRFNVHVAAAAGDELCRRFAHGGGDHYVDTRYGLDDAGLPVLYESLAIFHCEVAGTVVAGDHVVCFGLVRQLTMPAETEDASPLVFWKGLLTEPRLPSDGESAMMGEAWAGVDWEPVGLLW
jgi:flavin reductase ActVB